MPPSSLKDNQYDLHKRQCKTERESSGQITTFVRWGESKSYRERKRKQRQRVWLLKEGTRGMCSIRGNRMHSLNQLRANPVALRHILIFITAWVGIHTSTSHGVFPPSPLNPSRSISISCFIHLFAQHKFVNPLRLCKHERFVNPLCILLLSGTFFSILP